MSTPGTSAAEAKQTGAKLHMGIAEQGKMYALLGHHALALVYYRQAIHMTVQAQDPEIFFRHYLECVMESLEQMGSYAEVLAYCAKAIELYAQDPSPSPLAQCDLAHIYERQGVALLKSGEPDEAIKAFERSSKVLEGSGQTLPLVQTLLRWLKAGLHVDTNRVLAEQRRNRYFSVRSDTVDAGRAIQLPDEQLYGPQTTQGSRA
jgi:tetratricopeptide (TPR) repeat protein